MHGFCKTATNNAWASKPTSSLYSCHSSSHKKEHSSLKNKWKSTI